MSNPTTLTTPSTGTPSMLDRAVLLQIETSRFGNSRRVSSTYVRTDADLELLSLTKKLLDSPELNAIGQHDSQVKNFLKTKCLPSIIKKGVFLIPLASFERVNTRLNAFASEREELVRSFIALYPAQKEMAQERLRELFDEENYPSVEVVAAGFTFRWNYVSFGVPDVLRDVNTQLFEQERAKANAQWQEAQDMVQELLRARMFQMVEQLNQKLTPNESGVAMGFKANSLQKVDEFLSEFDALNITGDADLAMLVERARELTQGLDRGAVRKSKDLAGALKTGFCELQEQLGAMLTQRPTRPISFEDE